MAATTTLTYNASAAAQNTDANGSPAITAGPWAAAVVVSNNLGAGISLFVRTDGGAASLAASTLNQTEVPPLTELTVANLQPLVNANTGAWRDGVTGAFDQSEAAGWTAQQNNAALYATAPNFASVIPSASASGTVTITFQ
jgi:hypothetical protein